MVDPQLNPRVLASSATPVSRRHEDCKTLQPPSLSRTDTRRTIMPAQSTMIPQQQLIDAAKAPLLAYNDKNWDAVRASLSSDCAYDEVATNRKVQGTDQVISVWQGWATAFPDSKAT